MIIGEREGVWKVPKYECRIFEQPIRDHPHTFVTILPVTRNGHKLGQVLISYVLFIKLFKMGNASGDTKFWFSGCLQVP